MYCWLLLRKLIILRWKCILHICYLFYHNCWSYIDEFIIFLSKKKTDVLVLHNFMTAAFVIKSITLIKHIDVKINGLKFENIFSNYIQVYVIWITDGQSSFNNCHSWGQQYFLKPMIDFTYFSQTAKRYSSCVVSL